jgi:hypothetical protein
MGQNSSGLLAGKTREGLRVTRLRRGQLDQRIQQNEEQHSQVACALVAGDAQDFG